MRSNFGSINTGLVHFFDMEQAPEYWGSCYIQGADFGEWDPHQK